MIITDLFAVVASVAVVDYLSEILIMIIKKEKVYFSILLVLYQKKSLAEKLLQAVCC